jgi:D-alanyl-D-alanine carboxypeptidase (penicillin-binding protein 5/6)
MAAGPGLDFFTAPPKIIFLTPMRPFAAIFAVLMLSAPFSPARAAESYIIVDDVTGHIFAEANPDEKRQIASLTKVASAMVVLDWADATKSSVAAEVEVPAAIAAVGGMNACGLQRGDRVSLRDLLYAAMMQSDNHAAYTLAHNIGQRLPNVQGLSPVDNFTAYMNALARKLKMKRTLFLNPHGIDNLEEPPYSTAADMARLTKYAYSNPAFNFYVSQRSREIEIAGPDGARRAFMLQNTNELLGQEGVEGVKTGRTTRAGDCLILAASREPQTVEVEGQKLAIPRRLIVVLLGSANRFGQGLEMVRRGWGMHDRWTTEGRPISKHSSI